MAAAEHQASAPPEHKTLRGSPENAAARRPTAHLGPWVSHFSDGLTDSTAAPAVPVAAAVAAVRAATTATATTSLPAEHRFAPP